MSRFFLVFGENGSGKTTFALTGDKPINYYEWDSGSWERAATSMNLGEGDVQVRQYYAPLTSLLDPGRVSVGDRGGIAPATAHVLEGWNDLFWGFVKDYLGDLKGAGYPVIDTSTKLWLAVRQAFLEQVQQAAGPERERLNALQYTEPNARMSQIVEAAKARGKDLVMLAHEGEVYLNDKPTGILKPDGFKELPNMADCTLRFSLRNKKPLAVIYKAGTGGLELVGREIEEPTLPNVNALLDAAIKLRRAGMPLPGSNDDLLELAAAL